MGDAQTGLPRASLLGLILFLILLAPVARGATPEERARALEAYVEKAVKDWDVAGLAMAVVKDDKVILSRGFGVRKAGEPTAVDADTVFAIASCSKAFTAAAVASLVDEGKLSWDDPVARYLPWFALYDPYVSAHLTIRDLLSHRSGLETFSGDLLWYDTTYTREDVLRRARFLKPVSEFRTRFGYQNILFLAAGQVVEVVSGKSWDAYVQERFFTPLGMKATTQFERLKTTQNLATPHIHADGKLTPTYFVNVDNVGPAASINASANDMALWLRLQLSRGQWQDKALFSRKSSWEMWKPVTVMPRSEEGARFMPEADFHAYGLGWGMFSYHGHKVLEHSGGLMGMISQVMLVPDQNLGVVFLSNTDTSPVGTLMLRAIETMLELPERDWSALGLERMAKGKAAEAEAEQKLISSRQKGSRPSLPLERYTGTYTSEMYGDAKVTLEKGKLSVRLVPSNTLLGSLEHWHYDTFRVTWKDPSLPKGMVTFVLDAQGIPVEVKVDTPNPDFDFTELKLMRAAP